MAFFGRRQKEDMASQEEGVFAGRRVTPQNAGQDKILKDLSFEKRKRKKEPKKPWSKKERLLVFAVFILTIAASGFLALYSRAWKLPGLPRFRIPALPLADFFKEEKIIIERETVNKENKEVGKRAVQEFKEKTENLSGVYGLFVVDLNGGLSYGVNEEEVFQAASLIKLPVMAGIFMEANAGNINLDQKYVLKSEDKVGGAGSLYGRPPGYEITYRNLVRLMGKESDNTAFNIVRKLLGDEKINRVLQKAGMVDTSLTKNETTPYDIGIFFEELWRGNLLSEESKKELLESLTDTIYEDWLSAGVPESIRVAHKFGRELHVVNDAGIVYSQKPFIVVLLSKGIVEAEADAIFPELAKMVYEAVVK